MQRLAELMGWTGWVPSRETQIVPVAMPSELSLRFAEFVPTWRHRAVSKTWHRTIIRMRLKQALDPKETWSMTHLLRGPDFVAHRLKLGPPCEELSGTAEVVLIDGLVVGGGPRECARSEGCYQCEMHKEQAMLRIQLVRVSGVGAGPDSREELLVPVVKALFQFQGF
ncbi:unnamed protein product [Cladocopium goreaui]|uniref:Alpha-ketoglutarate-dependent dioxygenase AlkB-like domain-containing protein n=1 Tax=Cladocopium goreaui TaxID=2562237 RepID=A0A9P1G677_9DINO|nr:unnamed protein product [Cladocopium goreaui]